MKEGSLQNLSEPDKEDLRQGQQMIKGTFEKMKDDDLNFRSLKDDDILFINNSMDMVIQQSNHQSINSNNNIVVNTTNINTNNMICNDKNIDLYQKDKTIDFLSPTFSLQFMASNRAMSNVSNNPDSFNVSQMNNNINVYHNTQSLSPKKIRHSRDNQSNILSSLGGGKKLTCDTNFRKSLDEHGIDENHTKSGLSFLCFNPSLLKNESTPMGIDQKQKPSSRYSFFFRVLVFASKLIQRSSAIRFKKLTANQFNIIDDFSSDYEYYVYQNPHIFLHKLSSMTTAKTFFKADSYSSKKDLFVMLMFQLSRNKMQNDVIRYFDYIIFIKYGDIPSKIGEIENKLQISKSKLNWIKLIKLEILVLLIAHVACCIFLRIGLTELEQDTDSWLTKFQFVETSTPQKYVMSLYYIVITMTTIGYGDIAPVTYYEKGFIVIVALIATNVCAYSFSQISEIVKYEQMVKSNFDNMMQGINLEMNKRGLNILLQHKVRKYFEYQHYQNQQKQQTSSNLIDNLPTQMKEEVLFEVNSDVIKQIHIFQQLSPECQKQISLSVKQKIFYPEEIIFREKELCDCIYYIVQGTVNLQVQIKTKLKRCETHPVKTIITLKRKEVFGYESFLFCQQNPYTAKSNDITVISYIEKPDLIKILNDFPLDFEKFMFIKDKVILSKQSRYLNTPCFSCNQNTHSLWNCPIVNPQIKIKRINQKKEQMIDRSKVVRKRVSYYNPLKDKIEIAKQALAVVAAQNEETIMSDVISLMNESNSQNDDDDSQDEDKQDLSSDVLDEEEENKIEIIKQMRHSKQGSLQRSQKSISLKEIKNILSLRSSSDENINSMNNTSQSSQNELTPSNNQINSITLRKLKSNELYVIEENEEETPIIPFTKKLLLTINQNNSINQTSRSLQQQQYQENQNTINHYIQTHENTNETQQDQDDINRDGIEEEKISNINEQFGTSRFRRGTGLSSNNEMYLTTSTNTFGNVPQQLAAPPLLSNFRPLLPKDGEQSDPSSQRQITQRKFQSSTSINNQQRLESQGEGDSTSLDQKINVTVLPNVLYSDVDFDKQNAPSLTKIISVPKINLIDFPGEDDENSKEISIENPKETYSSRRGSGNTIKKKSDTPPNNQSHLSNSNKKKKREQESSGRIFRSATISLNQISSLDDIPMSTPTNQNKKREIKKKSSFEQVPEYQYVDNQKSHFSKQPSSQCIKIEKMRQKSHSQIIETDSLPKHLIPIIFNQKSSTNIDKLCYQAGQGKHKKNTQPVIPIRKKSDASIVCLINPNTLIETAQETRQGIREIHDQHQTTSEFQIRCETNLQDLDMLIVRKEFMLEQQRGYLHNFILVDDNEFDIDQMCEYKEYYPNDNIKVVLKRLRRAHKKSIKGKSPLRIASKIRQKRQSKQSDIVRSIKGPNTKNTIAVQSTSIERFSLKI